MELTKEHFDQAVADLTADIRESERRVIKHADDLQAELAQMVSAGFADVAERLDVRNQVERHEKALEQISQKLGLRFEL